MIKDYNKKIDEIFKPYYDANNYLLFVWLSVAGAFALMALLMQFA